MPYVLQQSVLPRKSLGLNSSEKKIDPGDSKTKKKSEKKTELTKSV